MDFDERDKNALDVLISNAEKRTCNFGEAPETTVLHQENFCSNTTADFAKADMDSELEEMSAEDLALKELFEDSMQILASFGGEEFETSVSESVPQRKKKKGHRRTNELKTRMTDDELKIFKRRVKGTGLSDSAYLRNIALTGQIVVKKQSDTERKILDEMAKISAEMGRQGGLLKMVIKPNEGQRIFAPEEWKELISTVREMRTLQKYMTEWGGKVFRGDYNTSNE